MIFHLFHLRHHLLQMSLISPSTYPYKSIKAFYLLLRTCHNWCCSISLSSTLQRSTQSSGTPWQMPFIAWNGSKDTVRIDRLKVAHATASPSHLGFSLRPSHRKSSLMCSEIHPHVDRQTCHETVSFVALRWSVFQEIFTGCKSLWEALRCLCVRRP